MNLVILILLAFFGLVMVGELAREFWAYLSTLWDGLVYGYSQRVGGGYDHRGGLAPGELVAYLGVER
jgi:hypothetical protein